MTRSPPQVRKKVCMVLHRFHQLDASAVNHLGSEMRRTLCDKDPSVMAASLCLLHALIESEPAKFKELAPRPSGNLARWSLALLVP